MSVRMAIVKLAALGAAGAVIGGGAVHMAEKAKEGAPQYIKHAKPAEQEWQRVTTTTTEEEQPEQQTAALVPQSPPDEQAAAPVPQPYYEAYNAAPPRYHHHHRHYPPYTPPLPPQPGPTPVPAPPMLVLFGAAAGALVARRMLAKQKAALV